MGDHEPSLPDDRAEQAGAPVTNGFAVASLVLGIVGAILALIPLGAPLATIFGILAVVFGVMGRDRARSGGAPRGAMATAGLVLGIIALAVAILWIIVVQLGS